MYTEEVIEILCFKSECNFFTECVNHSLVSSQIILALVLNLSVSLKLLASITSVFKTFNIYLRPLFFRGPPLKTTSAVGDWRPSLKTKINITRDDCTLKKQSIFNNYPAKSCGISCDT